MEYSRKASVEPLLLSIPDVAASLGLCRSKVYELIAKRGIVLDKQGGSASFPDEPR